MKLDLTEDELYTLSKCVLHEVDAMGRMNDPRIEELVDLDEKISQALYIEPRAHAVFVKALDREECSVIWWHPYPEEKPPETGYYLITVDLGRGIYVRSDHYTDGSVMLGGRWDEGFVVCGTKPIAWAYMPDPYRGGK